jgi:hypothetical protein
MDEWWREIDDAVLACFGQTGGTSPDEIGRRLGMSEEAAVSILSMLAQQGRVRFSRAEPREVAPETLPKPSRGAADDLVLVEPSDEPASGRGRALA